MNLEEAETCRDQMIQEKKLVTNEVEALGAENQRLKNYVNNKEKKITKLEKRASDLKRRGYTPEIVRELADADKRSAKKLLRQISNAEDCIKLTREVKRLKNEKESLEDDNRTKQKVKESLQYDIHILEQQCTRAKPMHFRF
jgi:FtsZ-binding cell division protein ZapB